MDPRTGMSLSDFLPAAGNAIMGGLSDVLSAPRKALWGAGPALVGRDGQGPQTGHDLLSRLGMNPDSGLTHALGFGAEVATDPFTLAGVSALGRGAQAAEGGSVLANRLQRFAGPQLQEGLSAGATRPTLGASVATPTGLRPMSGPLRPPTPVGTRGSVLPEAFGWDAATLRSQQLNSPSFLPGAPVYGLGTPAFSQVAPAAAPVAEAAATAVPGAQSRLLDRLSRATRPMAGSAID